MGKYISHLTSPISYLRGYRRAFPRRKKHLTAPLGFATVPTMQLDSVSGEIGFFGSPEPPGPLARAFSVKP